MKELFVFDTTLRDGAQAPGISFSINDKLKIVSLLDDLGVDFIEAGNPSGAPKDAELFARLQKRSFRAKICAFTACCKVGHNPDSDASVTAALEAGTEYVSVVGKASVFIVRNILKTTSAENLRIISETIKFFISQKRKVIFDAEHFFDGYKYDPEYSLKAVETAFFAGAEAVTLCDTNGGSLPAEIGAAAKDVCSRHPGKIIGIHCHNDLGLATSGSLAALEAGARQLQCTLLGLGERCGNANISTLLPILKYKLGYSARCTEDLSELTAVSRRVADIANVAFDERQPFVGSCAFTHKAGMHIDALQKLPESSELFDPSIFGNIRHISIGELSGRSALLLKVRELEPSITRDSPEINILLEKIKHFEKRGYFYENADASLKLLIYDTLGRRRNFFELLNFKLVLSEPGQGLPAVAMIKIAVDGAEETTAAEGNGPVNAMDNALRKALARFYPELDKMKLIDYKVRVLNSDAATEATVRVLIESGDGEKTWTTVGVSTDIMEASWKALMDSVEYMLIAEQ